MGTLITVGVFILFDIITGILKAIYNEGIDSTYLRKGLLHKITEILTVVGALLLEVGSQYVNIKIDLPIFNVVSVYVCTMELISVLENLGEVNPKLGKVLKPYLQKLKDKDKDNESEDE